MGLQMLRKKLFPSLHPETEVRRFLQQVGTPSPTPNYITCHILSGDNQGAQSLKLKNKPDFRPLFKSTETTTQKSLCLHRARMIIEHFIIQLMHNIKYVDTIKIIKYLKVFQHVSDHRGSIIREPCTVLG